MNTISLLQNKGGCGKSSLTVNLAVQFHLMDLATLIVDLDPQGTTSLWSKQRAGQDPSCVAGQAHQLEDILSSAERNGADMIVIDTPPRSDSVALAAARASNLVLMPCRPSLPDLDALKLTSDLVSIAKMQDQAYVVLNAVPANKTVEHDSQQAIKAMELNLAPMTIGNRIGFSHAFTSGQGIAEFKPTDKGTNEIRRLANWLSKLL